MPLTYGDNRHIDALTFALGIHTDLENVIYNAEYPEHEWPNIVLPDQIKSNINPGATSVAYKTRDHKGHAAFIGNGPNNDIPMVGVSMGAVEVPLVPSAVGFQMTNADVRQYRFGHNADLVGDLGDAAAQAADNLIEKSIVFGAEDIGFKPWINYPGINIIDATKRWATMTPEEKNETLNHMINSMWEGTKTLFIPTDLYVPNLIYADMVNNPMVVGGVGVATSIMGYFKANNLATQLRGSLNIHPSRYLSTAGSDSQNRIVAICRDVKNQVWPNPMNYTIDRPVQAPLGAAWYGEQVFGSYHVRQIGSMLYMDGI